ncbi:FGGY-family carbohydrate kinase [Limibacterium fermenti]|uniref:FGGY-family carbohydrate kinase n=1 Tax=Limibacterium fermenti TaxID=3229863 RepID=UPI000E8E5E7C|nr:glycerol kinase [Porphyromonadaceae bacterium]
MRQKIIAIDQSTSTTKAVLFSEELVLLREVDIPHQQYYPQTGWVEHDAEEIYQNVLTAIACLIKEKGEENCTYSLAITNQRETVVVWNKNTGKPIYHAVVWQCLRGTDICKDLKARGYDKVVQERTGLLLDPYFSASGVKWILDNVKDAREMAERGELLLGTIDSWLIWKLTEGKEHLTDYTNASRTLLLNLYTLDWDDTLLELFTIPRSMMPRIMACDSVFGRTTINNLFKNPIQIAGVIGDSHGALVGQMCFEAGLGKATYGTGSSIMLNIGEAPAVAPKGLVTTIGFAALGKIYYAFEGNIHCTGATIKWIVENLKLIDSPDQIEELASKVEDTQGVYLVPAFAGLGAPWWRADAKAAILGMTLKTEKNIVLRAALESIAYQIKDLVSLMSDKAGISLRELRVDGGPTKNHLLMQFQADILQTTIRCSDIENASVLGAVIMNGLARNIWNNFKDIANLFNSKKYFSPKMDKKKVEVLDVGWHEAVNRILN